METYSVKRGMDDNVLWCGLRKLGKALDEVYADAMILVSWTTGANRDNVIKVTDFDVEMIRGLPGVLPWRSGKLQNGSRRVPVAGAKASLNSKVE